MKDSRAGQTERFFQRQEHFQHGENSAYDEAHGPRNKVHSNVKEHYPELEEKEPTFRYAFSDDSSRIKAAAKFLCSACPRRNTTSTMGEGK